MIMKFIRWALGKLILTLDTVFSPKPMPRAPDEMALLDRETSRFLLYQFVACPFCVKVRRVIKRLNLKIELRDAREKRFADELVLGGGELQVPCLRITEQNGAIRWLYESDEIIRYLENAYGRRSGSST